MLKLFIIYNSYIFTYSKFKLKNLKEGNYKVVDDNDESITS